jgi:hypothetical protein
MDLLDLMLERGVIKLSEEGSVHIVFPLLLAVLSVNCWGFASCLDLA